MSLDKKPFHIIVAEKLIEQLREGTAPWQKPWARGEAASLMPFNPSTGKRYKGINALHLMSAGRTDQRWMTYKQALAFNAQVRKNERGTQIQYWQFNEEHTQQDSTGMPLRDESGAPLRTTVQLERPRVFFATVFNAEQIDGLPVAAQREAQAWHAIERAEQILLASGALINHGERDRAFYCPSTDSIHLPDRGQFPTADNYYATALHELGHWTGHRTRLDRDLAHPFGSEGYAREELRAEISSMILGDELGIGHDPAQHAAYVGAWIKALEEDPLEIFRAAADAERIFDHVLNLELKQVQAQKTLQAISNTDEAELEMKLSRSDSSIEGYTERAEAWLLSRIVQGTVERAADRASTPQLHRMQQVLLTMLPITEQNEVWRRNPLPHDAEALRSKIDDAFSSIAQRLADAPLAAARLHLMRAEQAGSPSDVNVEIYEINSNNVLGFPLPHDWNGGVRVEGLVFKVIDGVRTPFSALAAGSAPEMWQVSATCADGTLVSLANYPTEQFAERLAERLKLIDAQSTIAEHEKGAKLARINEERVRRNPDSTQEDLQAAKQSRKDAEYVAMTNDADLQRRIALEEQQLAYQANVATAAVNLADREKATKLFIDVPFKEKDEAKSLGARWDRQLQSWYVPAEVDASLFTKWRPGASEAAAGTTAADMALASVLAENQIIQRHFLAVPYGDREKARAAGAKWDRAAKSWYADPGTDINALGKWNPEILRTQQSPAMTAKEEFTESLKSLGCVISGLHPIMDGKKHRITVEGEKFSKNSGSGFYVGHSDGHPAGYVKNNKTGAELNWKSKGYVLDPLEKARLAAEAAEKLQLRETAVAELHEQAAQRVCTQLLQLLPVELPTPYMLAKRIAPQAGAFTDSEGKTTYLPVTDADGKQWSMQYIDEDGTKRFAKDSRKEACFHVVGGMDCLVDVPVLVIGEGYATAVQLKQSLGYATVCAFDAGNLASVAKALHQKFPSKTVVIAGDDDRHLEITLGVNPGRIKAEEAAKLVGGKVLLPIFAPGENSYPAELELVTPAQFREHQKSGNALSSDQLDALVRMKQFTDFNDLAVNSRMGKAAVERQLRLLLDLCELPFSISLTSRHSVVQRMSTLGT